MSEPLLMPFQDLPFNGDSFVCKEFLKLKETFELNRAVETGSCLYSTTEWLGKNFKDVNTIELSAEYSKHGIHKVAQMPNVLPEIGDSVQFLRNLMTKLSKEDRVIYFLDAHWGQNCPLLDELDALKASPTELPPVIAIHDWYTGDEKLGWDEYNGQRFEYSWIEPKIKELEIAHNCTYKHYFNTEAENGMRGLIYLEPIRTWVNYITDAPKIKKYSQTGEEGYIDYILSSLKKEIEIFEVPKHLVEIGAWDGFHLSNTRYFIENGYSHLLIDGDNRGNEEVKQHFINAENVLGILEKYETPKMFELLCVDIDGNDLYVIDKILTQYKPMLIVAEYNPIFMPNQSKAIAYDPNHQWNNDDYYGFSFLAGKKMAEKYGYVCVFENDSLNMYFCPKEFAIDPNINYKPMNYHPRSPKTSWVDY